VSDDTPSIPHMRQMPDEVVARLASIIRSEFPAGLPYTLRLEMEAWVETRTVHDAGRCSRALRYCYGKPGLADEIDEAING
jgi:hypothetical protein